MALFYATLYPHVHVWNLLPTWFMSIMSAALVKYLWPTLHSQLSMSRLYVYNRAAPALVFWYMMSIKASQLSAFQFLQPFKIFFGFTFTFNFGYY